MTVPTLSVLNTLIDPPGALLYGYDLMQRSGLKSGTLYPILARLERLGFLSSSWEAIDPVQAGRPPRRVYALTPEGQHFAMTELERARQALGGRWSHV